MRVATGPAMTRVRSSTRTPAAGSSGSPASGTSGRTGAVSSRSRVTSGCAAIARPCGCAAHRPGVRRAIASPPAYTVSSTSMADRSASTSATTSVRGARLSGTPSAPSSRFWWCG